METLQSRIEHALSDRKALSPALNDPTTAVLVLDQIHHLLRRVGQRDLCTYVIPESMRASVGIERSE